MLEFMIWLINKQVIVIKNYIQHHYWLAFTVKAKTVRISLSSNKSSWSWKRSK